MKKNICIKTIGLRNTDIISVEAGFTIHSLKYYLHEFDVPYHLTSGKEEMILIYVDQIQIHHNGFIKLMRGVVKSISLVIWGFGVPVLLPFMGSVHVRATDVRTRALPYFQSLLSRIWAHTDQVCRFRKIQIWIPLRKSARGARVPEFYKKLIKIISENANSLTQVNWK